MVTFKQYLNESQNYPLYHGTTLNSFVKIITQNRLKARSDANGNHDQYEIMRSKGTISLTRNPKFAKYWGKRMHDYGSYPDDPMHPVVFVINREKLRTKYKIIPYNHFAYRGKARNSFTDRWSIYDGPPEDPQKSYRNLDTNQYEERVVGEIIDLDKYVVGVIMSEKTLNTIKERYPSVYTTIKQKGWVQ